MAASASLSRFEETAPEILERIARYAVAFTSLGPPSILCNLCLLSRRMNGVFGNNSHLYASIFSLKFDCTALFRRFSQRWQTSRCLATELKKRFKALRRIRSRTASLDDLWTAYLMLLEDDGMNERQLLEWADAEGFLRHTVSLSNTPGPGLWGDLEGVSLISWLLWMTSSRDSLRREDEAVQSSIIQTMHPLLVAGYRYPNIFAPDSHFLLPLCPHSDPPPVRPSPPAPRVAKIQHYGHDLHLAVPLISSAASLTLVSRYEILSDSHGLHDNTQLLPRNREEADVVGHRGATIEDIIEFQYRTRIRLPEQRPLCPEYPPCSDEDEDQNSARHDADWSRLVACYDPWLSVDDAPLRGSVYRPGALCGSWAGRILQPNFDRYLEEMRHPSQGAHHVPIYHQPLYMRLQEHHCLHPTHPLPISVDETSFDDILNAWLPRGLDLRHLEDAIEVYDQTSESYIRYETYNSSDQAPYNKAATEHLGRSWRNESPLSDMEYEPSEGAPAELLEPIYVDDDHEYEDTVVHQSSGIADILITGETGERHGAAWGHYAIVGRVRPWDGLIVLLRTPVDSNQAHSGQWIFKGYLHDQNLVGRWRETSTRVDRIGYEGAFVMGKVDSE